MEDIKVNEYVRTIDGYIRKVIQVNEKGSYKNLCYGTYSVDKTYKSSQGISAKKIKSHSPNITDLIEVGDYVNGSYVEGFIEKNKFQNKLIITEAGMIDNNDIRSIVTKEMMKSIEYRVD